MPYSIEIVASAGWEIFEAFDWYEQQQEGLGVWVFRRLGNFLFTD